MSPIRFRPATMDDASLLLGWRNDPVTRASSIRGEAIERDDHLRWLEGSLASATRDLRIAIEDGVPVGTVRIDRHDDGSRELSWTVAPEARARGLGTRMVATITAEIGEPLVARIFAQNVASRRIAEQAGFALAAESEDGLQTWTLTSR
jgi:RimJ/RimL family protein N-acetyltransferase